MAVLERLLQAGSFFRAVLLLAGSVWILYLYIRIAYFSRTFGGRAATFTPTLGGDSLAPQIAVVLGLPLFLLVALVLLRGVITWSFDLQDLRET